MRFTCLKRQLKCLNRIFDAVTPEIAGLHHNKGKAGRERRMIFPAAVADKYNRRRKFVPSAICSFHACSI
jgi:hypothetical protein